MSTTMDPPQAPEQSPIDPRFHQRRMEVAKEAGRRRLKWVIAVIAVVVLLAAAAGIVHAPFLSVDDVTVSGAVYTDPTALAAVVASVDGEPMLTLDEGAVERQLEALPWVRRARVQRDWPNTLRIELAERQPLAVYGGEDGRWHVVDTEGVVLAQLDGRPIDVLLLTGIWPAATTGQMVPDSLAGAIRVARALPPSLKARTLELAVAADGNLELHLQPQGTVLLGPPDSVRDKLVATLTVLGELDPAAVGVIDVRAPANPVTTPQGAPAAGAAGAATPTTAPPAQAGPPTTATAAAAPPLTGATG